MKALTVKQPWAWAILHGGKAIENRTANWSYRGPLAIHAARAWSERGASDPRITAAAATAPDRAVAPLGAILGVVELVDAHPDTGCCRPWGESEYSEHTGRLRRAVTHLVLEDPRLLPEPIPARGALGLWTPSPEVVAALEELRSAVPGAGVPRLAGGRR